MNSGDNRSMTLLKAQKEKVFALAMLKIKLGCPDMATSLFSGDKNYKKFEQSLKGTRRQR
jgi:hypothetical protein